MNYKLQIALFLKTHPCPLGLEYALLESTKLSILVLQASCHKNYFKNKFWCTKCVSTSQIFVTVDNQQNLYYSRCCSQACYKNTAQSLFIQFRDINSIYCCSVKSYEKKWDENFPVILGLGMKALKVVHKLIGLLFVKNKSDCWK